MTVRLYERLVETKHHRGRLYCHVPDLKEFNLKRWKNNDWHEGEEQDTDEFLNFDQKI